MLTINIILFYILHATIVPKNVKNMVNLYNILQLPKHENLDYGGSIVLKFDADKLDSITWINYDKLINLILYNYHKWTILFTVLSTWQKGKEKTVEVSEV